MALAKLGDYIEPLGNRNAALLYGLEDVRGINNLKQMIKTKADMSSRRFDNFYVVNPREFVFNHRTSRNGSKFSVTYNYDSEPHIFTEDYVVFRVKDEEQLLPEWLYMYICRPEFDRYVIWNSWGSSTEFFNWEDICEVRLVIPPVAIQQKYVAVYQSMIANQRAYERGLDDLKLSCDAYIENLRKRIPCEPIGQYLRECDERNSDLSISLTQGVDVNMQFIPAKREAVDKESTRIVRNGQFAFNKVVKSRGTKLPIALRNGPDCIISGSYQVFEVSDTRKLLPEYLMLWMARPETQRFCGFNAWGSTRDVFLFDELCTLEFPIPDIALQSCIVNIYKAYTERKAINEKLKAQIRDICPILIKGSIEEAEAGRDNL